jgi:hypothetical protein
MEYDPPQNDPNRIFPFFYLSRIGNSFPKRVLIRKKPAWLVRACELPAAAALGCWLPGRRSPQRCNLTARGRAGSTNGDRRRGYQAQVFGGVPCRQTGMATIAKSTVDSAAVVTALGVLEAEYGELLRTYQVRSGRCPCFASRTG